MSTTRRGTLGLALLVALSGCTGDGGDRNAVATPPSGLPSTSAAASPPTTSAPSAPATTAPVTSDACPASFLPRATPWVPAPPTTETPGRLAPDADPVTAVVCRYAPLAAGTAASSQPTALVGEVPLTRGLDRVRTDLALPKAPAAPPPCAAAADPPVPHLLRLDYSDGSLWISATRTAGECTTSGNGAFVTNTYLGEVLSASYDAAAWTSPS